VSRRDCERAVRDREAVEGLRREAFNKVCEYVMRHPDESVAKACVVVWNRQMPFPSVRDLFEYCIKRHRVVVCHAAYRDTMP